MEVKDINRSNKWGIENDLQKALALAFVADYCRINGLSSEKLKNQRFGLSYNECGFFQPSEEEPNGLINDKETMPKATLIIKQIESQLVIEETPYTKQYLNNMDE